MGQEYISEVAAKSQFLFDQTAEMLAGRTAPDRRDGSTNRIPGRYEIIHRQIEFPSEAEVTVIIPTFNRPDLLLAAVDSVYRNSDVAFEVVIVNDGGMDIPPAILHSLEQRHSITIARHYVNLGLGAARNTGAWLARADWIMMLDDDDALVEGSLKALLRLAQDDRDTHFLFGDHVRQWYAGDVPTCTEYRHIGSDFHAELPTENLVICGSFMIGRQTFADLRGYREDLPVHEDYNLHLRVLSSTRSAYLATPICTYHCRLGLPRLNHRPLYWFATSAFNHAVFRFLFHKADDRATKLAQRHNQYEHLARSLREGCPPDFAQRLVHQWWRTLQSRGLNAEIDLDEEVIADIRLSLTSVPSSPRISPRISVIIPCYNLGQYLDEAVDSVFAQTYQDFEIIVVNDGSTDPFTRELLASYRRPRTRVLQSEHKGVMHARNLGIAAAGGDYLCALDADDKLGPSYFEKATRILDTDESLTFVSCWLRTFGDEDWEWRRDNCDFPVLLGECTVATPALVRRSAVLTVGGYDYRMPEQGYEDWDLWISLVERGFRGTIIPEVLSYYRRRPASVSRACEQPDRHLRLLRYLIDKHRDSYQKHLFELLLRKEAESDELLKSAYASNRPFEGSTLPALEFRKDELKRRQAGFATAASAQDLLHSLDELERDVIRECEEWQRRARQRASQQRQAATPDPGLPIASPGRGVSASLSFIYHRLTGRHSAGVRKRE